jgi:hypothetical protein
MRASRAAFAAAAFSLLALSSAPLGAQSAQPWSIQASLFGANAKLGASSVGGAGFEVQGRYTPAGIWSLGAGLQSTTHTSGREELTLSGVFIEPRVAIDIGSDRVAPYLAGRLAALTQTSDLTGAPNAESNGMAFGAGGGLLFRAGTKVNFDLGVAMVSQSFSDAKAANGATVKFKSFMGYVAKFGISVGFGSR